MGFVKFACFLLVALLVSSFSFSLLKFHQAKVAAANKVNVATVEKGAVLDKIAIGGESRKLNRNMMMMMVMEKEKLEKSRRKTMGVMAEMKISNVVVSISNQTVRKCLKKLNKQKQKQQGSDNNNTVIASVPAVDNADYMTYMHHPPKHN